MAVTWEEERLPVNQPRLIDHQQDGRTILVTFLTEHLFARNELDAIFVQLNQFIANQSQLHLILNFKRVNHISSVFIGKLMALIKKMKRSDSHLELTEVNEQVFEVFILTRIDNQLSIKRSSDRSNPVSRLMQRARQDVRPAVTLLAAGAVGIILTIIFVSQAIFSPQEFFQQSAITLASCGIFFLAGPIVATGWAKRDQFIDIPIRTQWIIASVIISLELFLILLIRICE